MLHKLIALCLVVIGSGAACREPTAPLPREGPPDELEFSIGGFAADMVVLELRGDTVRVIRRPWDWRPGQVLDTVRAVPASDAWRQFWLVAERAGLEHWGSRYSADVVDGVGWTLRLVAGEFALESTGSNAYPDWRGRGHELEMTDEFRALQEALGNLVGVSLDLWIDS